MNTHGIGIKHTRSILMMISPQHQMRLFFLLHNKGPKEKLAILAAQWDQTVSRSRRRRSQMTQNNKSNCQRISIIVSCSPPVIRLALKLLPSESRDIAEQIERMQQRKLKLSTCPSLRLWYWCYSERQSLGWVVECGECKQWWHAHCAE